MRIFPNLKDKDDIEYLKFLKPKKWQLDQLKLNPSYVHWGNNEDYMWNDKTQWSSRVFLENFSDMWEIDEYNEVVHFYFHLNNDDEKGCKLQLQLWILHPRKGASRGLLIKEIKKEELKEVYNFLLEAKKRSIEKFSKINMPEE